MPMIKLGKQASGCWVRATSSSNHVSSVTLRLIAQRLIPRKAAPTVKRIGTRAFRRGSTSAAGASAFRTRRFSSKSLSAEKDAVYIQGEVANEKVDLQPPLQSFHFFCSEHNPGAIELMAELAGELSVPLSGPRASRASWMSNSERRLSMTSWISNKRYLLTTTNLDNLARCDHLLVCLGGANLILPSSHPTSYIITSYIIHHTSHILRASPYTLP